MTVLLALLMFVFLLFYLPIRVGAIGSYGEEGLQLKVWIALLAGATGFGIHYRDGQKRLIPILGVWLPWGKILKKKESKVVAEDEQDGEESESPSGEETDEGDADRKSVRTVGESVVKPVEPADEETASGIEEERSLAERISDLFAKVDRIFGHVQKLLPSTGRFLRRLLRVVVFRKLRCSGVFGATNPSMTGQIYGYLLAVSRFLGRRVDVQVSPDFTRAQIAGEVEIQVSIYVTRLIWAVICLAFRAGRVILTDYAGRWLQAHVWVRFGGARS